MTLRVDAHHHVEGNCLRTFEDGHEQMLRTRAFRASFPPSTRIPLQVKLGTIIASAMAAKGASGIRVGHYEQYVDGCSTCETAKRLRGPAEVT